MRNPSIEKLQSLRLQGMATALEEQLQQPDINELSFDEQFSLLIDREALERENRGLKRRLKKARLKQNACIEDIDFKSPRGLDRTALMELSQCAWVKNNRNILVVGPTGTGKTYLACALSHKACLQGCSALYLRLPRILPELIIARGDGSYTKRMNEISKAQVLILDDWGLLSLNSEHRRDLLEILDDRHNRSSTIVTSQIPIKLWHETINENTIADAILDRLVHNAYRVELQGESMRKRQAKLTEKEEA